MAIVKREKYENAVVSNLDNGFVVDVSGYAGNGSWITERTYCKDLLDVCAALNHYYSLECADE